MPKSIGQKEFDQQSWGGLKPLARAVLMVPAVNLLARKLLPPALAARVPVVAPSAVYRGREGLTVVLLEPADCQVAAELHRNGGRFAHAADETVMAYLQALAGETASFLDIGAYTGLFALLAARANPALRAVAYEILPQTHELLKRNIAANGVEGRVEARLVGLAEAPGVLNMPVALRTSSLPSSLSITSKFDGRGIDVPLARLDSEVTGLSGPFAMKIDVEGHEPAVLRGGLEFLSRERPDIIAEVLPGEGAEVQAILAPLGYGFWHFTADGLQRRDTLAGIRGQRDWLLTLREDPNQLLRPRQP